MSFRHDDEEIPLTRMFDYEDSDAAKEPPPTYSEAITNVPPTRLMEPRPQPTATALPEPRQTTLTPRRRGRSCLSCAVAFSTLSFHVLLFSFLGVGFLVAGIAW